MKPYVVKLGDRWAWGCWHCAPCEGGLRYGLAWWQAVACATAHATSWAHRA